MVNRRSFPLALHLLLVASGVGLGACSAEQDSAAVVRQEKIVFGNDDRKQYYNHPTEWLRERAKSTAVAMIRPEDLDLRNPLHVRLGPDIQTVGERHDLCDDVIYREEPAAANCSGTLIGEDLVLTAGHCLGGNQCSQYAFVFNYLYDAEGELANITTDDVYYCRQRLVYNDDDLYDHAIIQLDRPVSPRHHPAPVRYEAKLLDEETPVATASCGQGIPEKLDDHGAVTDNSVDTINDKPKYFQQTLDTFPGSSGAGVYTHDGRVAGVHVRGADSYLKKGKCFILTTTYDGPLGGGGDASYVSNAIADLCATDYPTPLCGGAVNLCKACDACAEGEACGALPTDEDTTYCATACDGDEDCDDGLSCQGEQCLPKPRCIAGNVYGLDACGRPGALVDECDEDEVCLDGDYACSPSGEGNTCETAEELALEDATIEGELDKNYRQNFLGSCGGLGQDRVYHFTVDRRVDFSATATGFDTVLYLRSDCGDPDSEILCRNDTRPPGDKGTLLATTLEPGEYFLVLDSDGFSPAPGGTFELKIEVSDAVDETDDAGDEDGGVDGGEGGKKDSGGCAVRGAGGSGMPGAGWLLTAAAAAVWAARRKRSQV